MTVFTSLLFIALFCSIFSWSFAWEKFCFHLLFEVFVTPFPEEGRKDAALKKLSTEFKLAINVIKTENILRNMVEAVQYRTFTPT